MAERLEGFTRAVAFGLCRLAGRKELRLGRGDERVSYVESTGHFQCYVWAALRTATICGAGPEARWLVDFLQNQGRLGFFRGLAATAGDPVGSVFPGAGDGARRAVGRTSARPAQLTISLGHVHPRVAALVFAEEPGRAQGFSHRQLQAWQPLIDQLAETITAEPTQLEIPTLTPRALAAISVAVALKPAGE